MPVPGATLIPSETLYPEDFLVLGSAVPAIHVREKPPLREHIILTTPTGRRYRWAGDETKAANVFQGLRYSSIMPGGFEQAECTLPRLAGADYQDLDPFSTLQICGPGGDVRGEYRLERAPRTSGDQLAVTPAAVGGQAYLDDNKSAKVIYVDRDLSRWGQMSAVRRLNAINSSPSFNVFDSSVAADKTNGLPTLITAWQETANKAVCEAWYDAGPGAQVASIYYEFLAGGNISLVATQRWWVAVAGDDAATTSEFSSNLAAASGSGTFTATVPMRYGLLQMDATTALSNVDYEVYWSNVAVFGDHGLTKRGAAPNQGVWASDAVAQAVRTWAPSLNFTEGSDGTIRPSGFVIPHLAFPDATTAGEIVKQATRFDLQDWAVWEDRTFWWAERNTFARKWRARTGIAQLQQTGPQADRVWESILVQYQDVDGSTRTVGPPGSGADIESDELKDSDPDNPANQLGITRRDLLVMGTGTPASAIKVGRRFLEETKLLDNSGSATFVGFVESDRGVLHSASEMRAGDLVQFIDGSDTSWRRIARTDHDYDTHTTTADIDGPPESLQALLERLDVVLVRLGV